MPQNKYPNEEQTNPAEIFVSSTVEKMGQFSQFVSKLSGKRIKPGNFLANILPQNFMGQSGWQCPHLINISPPLDVSYHRPRPEVVDSYCSVWDFPVTTKRTTYLLYGQFSAILKINTTSARKRSFKVVFNEPKRTWRCYPNHKTVDRLKTNN